MVVRALLALLTITCRFLRFVIGDEDITLDADLDRRSSSRKEPAETANERPSAHAPVGGPQQDASGVNIGIQTMPTKVMVRDAFVQSKVVNRDVCSQSQTTYTAVRQVANPQFQPLPEDSHGCFIIPSFPSRP